MPRFKWDETGDRLYELGDKHGVLYPNYDNTSKRFTGGVPWNGLTAVTESPSGAEANAMYADDTKYGEIRSAEEFGATIEAYTYPDEWAECDGSKALGEKGGMIIGQQRRKTFGFSYVTTIGNDEDGMEHGYKLHLIYNATASPSEKSYATINDSPEAITFSWELTTTPVAVDTLQDKSGKEYKPTACITIISNKVDANRLKALEDVLYDSESAYLPTPYEVYTMLFGESSIGVESVELSTSSVTLAPSGTTTVTATVLPDNATNKNLTVSSGDTTKVTVTNTEGSADIVLTAVEGVTSAEDVYISVASIDNPNATAFIVVDIAE